MKSYSIIEIQTNGDTTTIVTPIPTETDPVEAEAKFLEKLPYARRSSLDVHTVMLIDNEGNVLAKKAFKK